MANAEAQVRLRGAGSTFMGKWQSEGGFVFREGQPDTVLSPATYGDTTYLVLARRGALPGRQWSFKAE